MWLAAGSSERRVVNQPGPPKVYGQGHVGAGPHLRDRLQGDRIKELDVIEPDQRGDGEEGPQVRPEAGGGHGLTFDRQPGSRQGVKKNGGLRALFRSQIFIARTQGQAVAFAHGGGAFPSTLGRIQHGFEVRPDLCAVDNQVGPRDHIGKFYVDSLVHDPRVLEQIVELFGENRIMLGSDYPFPLGEDEPGKLIESMSGLSRSAREKLLYQNALEWLGPGGDRLQKGLGATK